MIYHVNEWLGEPVEQFEDESNGGYTMIYRAGNHYIRFDHNEPHGFIHSAANY